MYICNTKAVEIKGTASVIHCVHYLLLEVRTLLKVLFNWYRGRCTKLGGMFDMTCSKLALQEAHHLEKIFSIMFNSMQRAQIMHKKQLNTHMRSFEPEPNLFTKSGNQKCKVNNSWWQRGNKRKKELNYITRKKFPIYVYMTN